MTESFLIPLEDYLKVGLHIGTKFRTKYMDPFIYKVRPDGLAVLNVKKIDERIAVASKFISQFAPSEILVICRRENGWSAVNKFSDLTGIPVIAGRYRPGSLTNTELEVFKETKMMLIVDPWPDKNAIHDAMLIGLPVVALCDTNNEANNIDLVVPCNNKGRRSLGLLFMVLAREFMKSKGMIKEDKDFKAELDDFGVD
ncbi:MAG: 30S ribosomal protein S2 [archaeon]